MADLAADAEEAVFALFLRIEERVQREVVRLGARLTRHDGVGFLFSTSNCGDVTVDTFHTRTVI